MRGKNSEYFSRGEYHNQQDLFGNNSKEPDNCFSETLTAIFELSSEAYSAVIHAEMDDGMNQGNLTRYVENIIAAVRKAEVPIGNRLARNMTCAENQLASRAAAERAAFDRGDPLVCMVLESASRVRHEIHRLLGFLRFNPLDNGVWLARCSPDNSVLQALAEHFTLRFGETPWAIIDEKRGSALVRPAGEEAVFGPLAAFPFLQIQQNREKPKDDWEELWRGYHHTICIENRKNPNLQALFMPRRYWKYLPEIAPPR